MRILRLIIIIGIAVAVIKSCDIDNRCATRDSPEISQSTKQSFKSVQENAATSDKDAIINRQNSIIAVQKDTISEQMKLILRQQAELKRALDRQTEMVYQAGCEFERLGDEGDQALNVSGKKDKIKVRTYKKAIYEKASQCFQQAAKMDHAGAKGRCEVISYKIASL